MVPPDDDFTNESSYVKCTKIDSTGKIHITGKDELRKPEGLGCSPGRADSRMLTVAKEPEQQEAFVVVG